MLLFIYLILTVLFLGVGMLLYHAPEELLAKYNINPIISIINLEKIADGLEVTLSELFKDV